MTLAAPKQILTGGATAVRRQMLVKPVHGLLVLLAAGTLFRIYPWFLAHNFTGILEYDDGVYYGSARALLAGRMPYRDFTILHPPLVPVLLTPFAFIGEVFGDPVGMASARVVTVGLGIGNAVSVWRLAKRAVSDWWAVAAAGFYLMYPNAVLAEHTVMLEPLVSAGCLMGCVFLLRTDDRSAANGIWAGVWFGLATMVKVFAVVYLIAAAAWLLSGRRGRQARALGAGYVAACAGIMAPFVAGAPNATFHDLVSTQLLRPTDGAGGMTHRLADLFVLRALPWQSWPPTLLLATLVCTAGIALLTRRTPTLLLWLGVAALTVVAFLRSPSYFSHYADFLAPGLAIILAAAGAAVWRSRPPLRWLAPTIAGTAAAILTAGTIQDLSSWTGQSDLARTAHRLVASDSCVVSDSVSLAISADLFAIPTADCPGWLDGRGVALTLEIQGPPIRPFYPAGFQQLTTWQRQSAAQLERADVLLTRLDPATLIEWSPQLRTYVAGHFHRTAQGAGSARWQLWQRNNGS